MLRVQIRLYIWPMLTFKPTIQGHPFPGTAGSDRWRVAAKRSEMSAHLVSGATRKPYAVSSNPHSNFTFNWAIWTPDLKVIGIWTQPGQYLETVQRYGSYSWFILTRIKQQILIQKNLQFIMWLVKAVQITRVKRQILTCCDRNDGNP